jgi:hypothetical protein
VMLPQWIDDIRMALWNRKVRKMKSGRKWGIQTIRITNREL